MPEKEILLEVSDISKSFGITKALQKVSFKLKKGEVLGLIGENGSGKSTMTSIIAALQKADEGTMLLEGQTYEPKNSTEAINNGVCMILQEKGTFELLSVANNIFIGKEEQFIEHGVLNTKRMNAEAQKLLNDLHAGHIKAEKKALELNFEDRKLIEVARAMYSNPKILVVDETTTALSRNGRDILYQIIKDMKEENKSVIFISHDLDEIMEVCDTVTILRDGQYIDTIEKKDYEPATLRRLMVGREVSENYYRADMESCKNPEVVLTMDKVTYQELQEVSFDLHKGEILGFGGLGDCGMHQIGYVAFGLAEPDLGKVLSGDKTQIKSARDAMSKKIAYISKNRDQETLMLSSSIRDNVCLASYDKIRKGIFVSKKDEEKFVEEHSADLRIKMQNPGQYVMELSGGNKQKVALAKWLGFGADIFIFDCPTRGIDIGVKANIYQLMIALKNQGKSIILISEELSEVIGMSDRIIILKNGKISGTFLREENVTEVKLVDYMV